MFHNIHTQLGDPKWDPTNLFSSPNAVNSNCVHTHAGVRDQAINSLNAAVGTGTVGTVAAATNIQVWFPYIPGVSSSLTSPLHL